MLWDRRLLCIREFGTIAQSFFYLHWLLTTGLGCLLVVKVFLFKQQPVTLLVIGCLSVFVLISIHILGDKKQDKRDKLSNGYLFVEEYNCVTVAKDQGFVQTINAKFRALKSGVDRWRHKIFWTGSDELELSLLHPKDGQLIGPIGDLDYTVYEIIFSNPSRKKKVSRGSIIWR